MSNYKVEFADGSVVVFADLMEFVKYRLFGAEHKRIPVTSTSPMPLDNPDVVAMIRIKNIITRRQLGKEDNEDFDDDFPF